MATPKANTTTATEKSKIKSSDLLSAMRAVTSNSSEKAKAKPEKAKEAPEKAKEAPEKAKPEAVQEAPETVQEAPEAVQEAPNYLRTVTTRTGQFKIYSFDELPPRRRQSSSPYKFNELLYDRQGFRVTCESKKEQAKKAKIMSGLATQAGVKYDAKFVVRSLPENAGKFDVVVIREGGPQVPEAKPEAVQEATEG